MAENHFNGIENPFPVFDNRRFQNHVPPFGVENPIHQVENPFHLLDQNPMFQNMFIPPPLAENLYQNMFIPPPPIGNMYDNIFIPLYQNMFIPPPMHDPLFKKTES